MSQFKYFIILFLYCCLLKNECNNITTFILLLIPTMFFSVKYIRMKKMLYGIGNVIQKNMQEQREKFVYSLSHDLRIPILAQLRVIELINLEKFGELNPVQKDMLKQTEQSCRCILNLISLLINTYNIENHNRKLIYKKFNMYELIISCFEELQVEAKEKNLTYEYVSGSKSLYINADEDEIRKVLINLILASVMYANYGGKISVKVVNFGNKLRFSVFCDGENTYSVNTNLDSRYTSIGESIRMHFCKKIIEIHKGQILHTINPKAMFEFELPKAMV